MSANNGLLAAPDPSERRRLASVHVATQSAASSISCSAFTGIYLLRGESRTGKDYIRGRHCIRCVVPC